MGSKSAAHVKVSPAMVRRVATSTRVADAYLRKSGYMQGDPQDLERVQAVLLDLHALIRGQHWMYWNSHWTTKGPGAYGQHLLFERFYDGEGEDEDQALQDDVDELAEKIVGYFGSKSLCMVKSMQLTLEWVRRWNEHSSCPVERGLCAEKDLQDALEITYEALKGADFMPLGLDDFLMSLASRHEANIYLLQQQQDS